MVFFPLEHLMDLKGQLKQKVSLFCDISVSEMSKPDKNKWKPEEKPKL
jgi:hypothetical protein